MAYLDTYTAPLTASTAAHLLRRATFGPTNQEIVDFTGKTATQAVDLLISNASYRASPPPPVEMDETRADAGQEFLTKPFDGSRTYEYFLWVRYWWIGLMTEQNGHPSVLEKLTAFWQNHFVVAQSSLGDYRFPDRYLRLLRANAMGNFRTMTIAITKDPGMLVFQNGNANTKESPNENYARELQELFTVGQKDFAGNANYTEDDVKAAAKVLTGWQDVNLWAAGSTSIGSVFTPSRHDVSNKTFSGKYNNTVIAGRSGATAGDEEVADLIDMLLRHPQTPKFICRKLYRWYVNSNVTQEIEDNVITPLATFFASAGNNYAIPPVLKRLLTSDIFFDNRNVGALVKSPAEFMIGMMRHLNQPVPDITTEFAPFRRMMQFQEWGMNTMQLRFLDQPLVFGSVPYYQTGYSKNWINGTTLGIRGAHTDAMVYPWLEIKPGYMLGIDFYKWIREIQPNFSDVAGTPAIPCEELFAQFSKNFFALELPESQKNFLIDTIMMRSVPRSTWIFELNKYRAAPTDAGWRNAVIGRCQALMKYMFRMAEYQVF
ncbi:DUF1800 domain-containing protein [Dyadobacter diqingensis]|uniref:DUF1800 domain-containing protein n=1 Tax=Dyadobacter diqingensis TaxID=2938121 RepID=UPI0020C5634D|nr:DUF1800 family protein [Dyadobacter diqingensis]